MSDQEQLKRFMEVFQTPTQIYRYLASRHKESPLFLHRNLSYMKLRSEKIRSEAENTPGSIIIHYNFYCGDSVCQTTKHSSLSCPWCYVPGRNIHSLLGHLKYCHSRFTSELATSNGIYNINIGINANYDGSYCGYKHPGHDLYRDFRFTPRDGPIKKQGKNILIGPQTQVIYARPSKNPIVSEASSVNDHMCDEGLCNNAPIRNRLYYHTSTCLPVKPDEVDIDSEADNDPAWLRERTQLMIDEFTDVNEGEKEILKRWNLHIMQNCRYKSDLKIPSACYHFIEDYGHEILAKKLYKNLTLHLANLYDYGLLSSDDVHRCITKIRQMRNEITSNKTKLEPQTYIDKLSPPAKKALYSSYTHVDMKNN